jgi:putative RecB family exonuclease
MEAVHQLELDGMPRRLYSCTPSRLRAWLDCPRRYRMTYLDRPSPPKGPPWAHNSFGASVHNALAGWWRLPREGRTPQAAGRLLESGWISEGYADDGQSGKYLARARTMVDRYVAGLDPDEEPAGVERVVATKTERIAVSGRIDRLDDRQLPPDEGGDRRRELVVVDYKTGRATLSVDDARSSLALALYALAAGRVLRRRCAKVELHHLPTEQVVAWEHTKESMDRHLQRAEDIADECARADEVFKAGQSKQAQQSDRIQAQLYGPEQAPARLSLDEVFPPQPGIWCGWCDFRAHCPEGKLAGPPRLPWDGLAAADDEIGPLR